ncbi:MAG TPA: hypothetical protein VN706_01190 [Gemmatimonadaceae bacterium]|nr:hypothetical protein [Gemmatimonadaceae bacterium]
MGNFYANITLRAADTAAAVAALTHLRRDAWVASDAGDVVVFDKACDDQDIHALEQLTIALSDRLHCSALAACNHDDDTLTLLLAASGTLLDRYDSNPGYFEGENLPPAGGDAKQLCTAFGVRGQIRELRRVLHADHSQFVLEVDRHRAMQAILALPPTLSFLGYRYVARGELAGDPAAATLQRVWGEDSASDAVPASHPALQSPTYEQAMAALQAEPNAFWAEFALALQDADVPESGRALFKVTRGNGQQLIAQLREYVRSHGLVGPDGWIRADDRLAEFLGEREFGHLALSRLLLKALGCEPLSAEVIEGFQRNDPATLARIARGFEKAMRAEDGEPDAAGEGTPE